MSGIGRGRGRSARPAAAGWLPSAMDATPAAVTFVPYGSGSASPMAAAAAGDVDDRVPLLAAAQSTSPSSAELAPASAPNEKAASSTAPAPTAPAAAAAASLGAGTAGAAAAGAAGVGQLQPASAASAASPGVEPWIHAAATGDVNVLRCASSPSPPSPPPYPPPSPSSILPHVQPPPSPPLPPLPNILDVNDLKAMLQGGRPVDVDSKNEEGLTALYIACENGHEAAARLLLERGADSMRPCGERGRLPIHAGAAGGHEHIVRLLLGRGIPVDVKSRRGATVFYIACQEGREAMARLLLERGADTSLVDEKGWHPLHIASNNGHGAVVRLLLERGAPVNAKDKNNFTPLFCAAEMGHVDAVQLLLERGADPALPCGPNGFHPSTLLQTTGTEPLSGAAGPALLSTVGLHAISPCAPVRPSGSQPHHVAAMNGHGAVVRLLLERGAPVDAKDKSGLTALSFAARNGHVDVARLLLERGADPALPCGPSSLQPLRIAAMNGHGAVVRLLLECGAPVDAKCESGLTALSYTAQNGHVDVARLLLERGADPELPCGSRGIQALHIAAELGNGAFVKLLLDHGSPVNAKTNTGSTALSSASRYGHEAVARLLLERGADPSLDDNENRLPIHAAVVSGNMPLFKLFLELGNPVTATCDKGKTILHIAAIYGCVDIIRLILSLQQGAELEAVDERGFTPLMTACWSGQAQATRCFLEAGAAWDKEDKEGVTALELALRWRQGALLDPFLECPRVLFTAAKLATICGQIVDAVAAECNPAAVVAKFPAHKLHCALHLARLLERAAKANPDQASLILECRDSAIDVTYQLLDAVGRLFRERVQRRATSLEGDSVTWVVAMARIAHGAETEASLRECVKLTADDPLDIWHANQLYKLKSKKSDCDSALSAAYDQQGPIADSVEALELCLPGVGSPLDMAIELDLYPFFGHPFVHRYIQRVSESASDLQAVSLLPSALVSLAQKVLSRDAEKEGKSEGKDGKSEKSAWEDKQTSEGELWWETPGHPLNSWKGKFAADLITYFIFLFLIALAVSSVLGEHGRPRPSVLALLAIQPLCMLLREYYQAREEGFREYFGDIFNLLDIALFVATPLLAILGIIAEAIPACARYADNVIPVLALVFIPASLRLLEFGYISPMLGPMLVVFGRMAQNVLSVLIVFLLVFASFVFALWGWSASVLGRASDGEPPITLAETAGSLYFGFLGETDYDLMRSRVPIVGSAFFSIYQIITVILLLNVLTGLFSFSFTDVFENAQHVYAFGRAKIILRYHRMGRRLVAPLNVVWLLLSPTPRLAAVVVNVISAALFLPFLSVALGLSYLSRLVGQLFETPTEKKQQEATAQSKALEAWLKAIETHRKARLADAAKEKTDAPLELKLKYPLAYDESKEKPDPVPPGPLKVAHTADNMPRNLETIHERTEKLEAGQAKLEEKIDAGQAEVKAGQAKLEASLAEVKAALAALAAPAARRSLFEF
eukprot:tig00000133_g7718.t1